MRSDKALRNAFRRLQLPTSDDPGNVVATLMPAIPPEVRNGWDALEGDDGARVAFAFEHPALAHLLTVGITLPTFREELEWLLARFDEGLPPGDVVDLGSGAGVAAAVLALATRRHVTACDPAKGAKSAIAHVAGAVGVEVGILEAPLSQLTPDAFVNARIGIAQSILSYVGFGFEKKTPEDEDERSALIHILTTIGNALVIEHTSNADDDTSTWRAFMTRMSTAGMHPVWETASFASGYNVFTPDLPAHERPRYARPKLCLRFSSHGDPHEPIPRLDTLLAQHPAGPGWTD